MMYLVEWNTVHDVIMSILDSNAKLYDAKQLKDDDRKTCHRLPSEGGVRFLKQIKNPVTQKPFTVANASIYTEHLECYS